MKSKNNIFRHEPLKYNIFRPNYPEDLFSFLKKMTTSRKMLECGAGSGQATKALSRYFDEIIACDASFGLLKESEPLKNVLLIQCHAESLPLPTGSMEFICVAQALHWFSLENFYSEVKRVLCHEGIIVALCYNQSVIDPVTDEIVRREVYEKITQSGEASLPAKYVHESYKTLPFPFKEVEAPDFEMKVTWNLNQLLGYINTWPSVLDYKNKHHVNLIENLSKNLREVWGNPLSTKLIRWPIYLRIGRNM